jgi:hypothetical protein
MNTANLELCKELWKLSGWETDDWYDLDDSGRPFEHLATLEDIDLQDTGNEYIPAYDLGYLLRKLPKFVEYLAEPVKYRPLLKIEDETYTIGYSFAGWKVFAEADTPEDAVCNLTIELFKQGILEKTV